MINRYSVINAVQTKRLTALVNRLNDRDLARLVGDKGWTVAAYLGHLAFWDQRALLLLRKWSQEGIGPSPYDTDIVNEAVRTICLALPVRAAAKLAVSIAAAVDEEIDSLDPKFLKQVETDGKSVPLDRGRHREHHLRLIEEAIGK
jgi:hypothetical protein